MIGGVPGATVDIITGATLDLFPKASMIHLERDKDYYKKLYGYDYWAEPPGEFGLRPGETVTVRRF